MPSILPTPPVSHSVVLSFRWTSSGLSTSAKERARNLIQEAEALGAVLCAFGPFEVTFLFEESALDDAAYFAARGVAEKEHNRAGLAMQVSGVEQPGPGHALRFKSQCLLEMPEQFLRRLTRLGRKQYPVEFEFLHVRQNLLGRALMRTEQHLGPDAQIAGQNRIRKARRHAAPKIERSDEQAIPVPHLAVQSLRRFARARAAKPLSRHQLAQLRLVIRGRTGQQQRGRAGPATSSCCSPCWARSAC